jgi:hypothetical protein
MIQEMEEKLQTIRQRIKTRKIGRIFMLMHITLTATMKLATEFSC